MADRQILKSLVQHFFQRFLDNEFVAGDAEMHLSFTRILALVSVPGLLIPGFLLPKYIDIGYFRPIQRELATLPDKYFFASFSFLIVGIVTVMIWDALFPDRRDYLVLIPMPLKVSAIFQAKASALLLFLSSFLVAVNAGGTITYALVSYPGKGAVWHLPATFAAHAVSTFGAGAFVFLALVGVQGFLINVLGRRIFEYVSAYVQWLLIVMLLSTFLAYFRVFSALHQVDTLTTSPWLWLPPLWFLGLYETLLGTRWPVMILLAHRAEAALAIAPAAAVMTYLISYRRHVKQTLEVEDVRTNEPGWAGGFLIAFANRMIVRRPVERATFHFIAQTIGRSKKHWLLLSAYVGTGSALVLEGAAALFSNAAQHHARWPTPELLSIPLVLSFFLLSGMRYIFTIPSELPANWAFRLARASYDPLCLTGVRKFMLAVGVLPLLTALLPLHVIIWGWQTALFHFTFDLVLCWMLTEVLLFSFRKIPFTCTYPPGKANAIALGGGYLLAFAAYAYSMARVECWLMQNASRVASFLMLAAAVFLASLIAGKHMLDENFEITYDDAPDPAVRTLELDA